MKRFLPLLILLFISSLLRADSIEHHRKIKVLPVPTLGYSPETKAYAGVVALLTMSKKDDTLTRFSNAKTELTYTRNRQFIAEASWNYLSPGEKRYILGSIHASRYPDLYHGIGLSGKAENPIQFESNRYKLELSALRARGGHWFLGPSIRYTLYNHIAGDSIYRYPELSRAYFLGTGFSIIKDQRDNLLNARKGHFFSSTTGLQRCSDHFYGKLTLDARYYHTIPRIFTLATRMYAQVNLNKPVYFDQAVAGGDAFVRGYFYGLYRNHHVGFVQSELRSFPWKRIGLAVFGGYSALFQDNWQPQASNLYNFGAGLRILVDKSQQINLRVDYAKGAYGQQGFYIAFGEAF